MQNEINHFLKEREYGTKIFNIFYFSNPKRYGM